jgi:hypothetical protein
VGSKRLLDPTLPLKINPDKSLEHSILAVSYAQDVDGINKENVAGFLYV